jgi:hypothetical protein
METQLYHCTKYNALKSILSEKRFKISYCLEEVDYDVNLPPMSFAVVCFADLREDELSKHMQKFHSDSYLIMNNSWATIKHLSPVVYYQNSSVLSTIIKFVFRYANQNKDTLLKGGLEGKMFYNSANVLCAYLKKYQGHYFIKEKNVFSDSETQFYLEREWRYYPIVDGGEACYLPEDEFLNIKMREQKMNEMIDKYSLGFSFDDIEEIGVPGYNYNGIKKFLKIISADSLVDKVKKVESFR